MQQTEADNIVLISQGNNSYIHRVQSASGQIVNKSILHDYKFQQQQTDSLFEYQHQIECKDLLNEWQILNQLDHENIIKPISFNDDNSINVRNKNIKCCTLQMENAICDCFQQCKEQKEYLEINQLLSYMQQTGLAVQYLHSKDIAHNDIKLENILVFNRELSKLADFGFSNKQQDQLNVQKWQIRTINAYSSPEIIQFQNSIHEANQIAMFMKNSQIDSDEYLSFSETSSDIFALTTSLFISVYKRAPILNGYASLNDPMYMLLQQNPDEFWDLEALQKIECQYLKHKIMTMDQLEALRDLIESGLSEEDYRININDWINHEFWKDLKDEEIKEKQSIHQNC